MANLPDSIDHVLLDETTIARRVGQMAAQISADYGDSKDVVLIGILKGAFIFLADLSRRLTIPHQIDFIAVSSYPGAETDSGAVRLIMDARAALPGRHVLIVEDILDTGKTLDYLVRTLQARDLASVKTCVLLRKPDRQKTNVNLDYLGFDIPNVWVVGYGLDWNDRFRTLPYIAALKPSVYGGERD